MNESQGQPHIGTQLARVGFGLLSAKARLIIVACGIAIALLCAACIFITLISANFQHTTAVWPVPVATDTAGNYRAGGWAISSTFGWRDTALDGGSEFHDGLDLVNPHGDCPFGYHCGARTMFDGQVRYVGWDQSGDDDPSKIGGGEVVILSNGEDDHQTIFAHLEPYRLYVRLEGKIEDSYDRDEYERYRDYQMIGAGELKPDLSDGGIEMTCQHEMPSFIPTRTGGGSVVFLYDRPANCTTTIVWGKRGGAWQGWIPDEPAHRGGDNERASLSWQTQITTGKRAKDVALRFRAHLVPPDPSPSPTAIPTVLGIETQHSNTNATARGGAAVQSGQGALAPGHPDDAGAASRNGAPRSCEQLAGGQIRCTWLFEDIPTEQERFAQRPDPWIVAALAAPTITTAEDHDTDAVGPTIPAATPTATASPADSHTSQRQTLLNGIGGTSAQQLPTPVPMGTARPVGTPAPIPTTPSGGEAQASLSPGERVWLAPGASATWTVTLANNQRGFWSIQVSPSDSHLTFGADTGCRASSGNSIICKLDGSVTTLHMFVYTAPDTGSMTADIPIAISDVDEGGSGALVGSPSLRIGVGTSPTVTPIQPTATTAPPGGGDTPDCAPQPLLRLTNVSAPQPSMVAPAAASFVEVRQEIVDRTGIDALAVLADVLRSPSFTSDKPGVVQTSWHKAGRALDLNQGGPFVRVPEGRMFRLYVSNVDITAIFEAHGWRRIPVQGETLEWWHYEYHPDNIAWTSAMLQVWDLATLQAAFPEIAWETIGCTGGSNTSTDPTTNSQERELMCILAAPSFSGSVTYIDGCGPPVRAGDKAYQLDTTLGFVGLSGNTSGPHLHLGLKVRNYDGAWPFIDICTPEFLEGRAVPPDANCYTDMADPMAFLPLAPPPAASAPLAGQQPQAAAAGTTPTPIIPERAPYQLPPPNYPGSLFFTPVPAATPVGQYWSPFEDGGQYGGGGVGEWLCGVWSELPWCP